MALIGLGIYLKMQNTHLKDGYKTQQDAKQIFQGFGFARVLHCRGVIKINDQIKASGPRYSSMFICHSTAQTRTYASCTIFMLHQGVKETL